MIKKVLIGVGVIILLIMLVAGYWIFNRIQTFSKFTRGEVVAENFHFQMPFEWIGSHIIVEAKLAGEKRKFLFDTGAGNILFSNKIDIGQFEAIGSANSTDSHGNTIEMPLLQVPSLEIGDLMINDITFKTTEFDQPCYDEVVGIIGYNTMRFANWQIDFEQQMIISSDSLELLNPQGQEITGDVNQFTYAIEVLLNDKNGEPIEFIFDTGSSGALLCDLDVLSRMAYGDSIIFLGGSSFGLSGKTSRDTTIVYISDDLKTGSVDFPTSYISVRENALELLGNDILRNYLVTISWDQEKIWLKPYRPVETLTLFPYGASYDEGYAVIDEIEVNASQASGIKPGDTIIAMNGEAIGSLKEAYCSARNSVKDSVQLQVMSHGDTVEVLFTAQELKAF